MEQSAAARRQHDMHVSRAPGATSLALILLCVVVSACGSPSSRRSAPPNALVSNGEQRIMLGPTSYCWGGLCADGVIDASRAPVIHIGRNDSLQFYSAALAGARTTSASVHPIESSVGARPIVIAEIGSALRFSLDAYRGRGQVDVLISVDGGDCRLQLRDRSGLSSTHNGPAAPRCEPLRPKKRSDPRRRRGRALRRRTQA